MKKLGLRAAAVPFRGASVQTSMPAEVAFKPSAKIKRRLRKMKSLKITVRFTALSSNGQTATITRRVTIKR